MKKISICSPSGDLSLVEVYPDSSLVETAMGPTPAASLVGSTQASLQINGVDPDGHVIYTAKHGGTAGNNLTIAHIVGDIGLGFESRLLSTLRNVNDITVIFGTDGAGATITPTASAVAAEVSGDSDLSDYVTAQYTGSGASNTSTSSTAPLQGGLDNGSLRKWKGLRPSLARINTVENI